MTKIDGLKLWKEQFPEDYEDARKQFKLKEICNEMGWKLPKYYKLTTDEFISKAKEKHSNKYDYSLVDYINSTTKVKIICPEHGVFEQTPNYHLRGYGCIKCCKRHGRKIKI